MFLPVLAPWSTAFAFAFAPAVFQDPPPVAPPAAAPAATKYDFPTRLAPAESRLIEIRIATSSTFHLELGGKATDTKERAESTTWIVDTLLDRASQPKDHLWSGRRRIVKAQATKNGVVDDPETNGFEADVWRDNQNQVHVQCATDRQVSQSTMDELILSAEAFGLGEGVLLPRGAAVGDEFHMLIGSLAPWCLTTEGRTPTASARLHLEAVDPEKNLARFKGPLHVEEILEKGAAQIGAPIGIKGTGVYDGDVAIEYDLAAHHIARIVCHAKAVLQGETVGGVTAKVSGTNVIETTITCSTGAPAASALNQKPQFRDVPHEVSNAGASIALPSHFTSFDLKGPKVAAFRSLLHGKDSIATVVVFPFPLPGKNLKEAGEAARKDLEGMAGVTVKSATASGGLGTASACEYTVRSLHGLHAVFQLESGRFVVVQCECFELAWAERSKEFPKYFQSLKKLPAAK
ncbi:MAG TPA: hypothetical protein VFG37_08360 [Planctomycetota bacterium]|nr:hypothetical protein [Planctomycetota bacterium]